jgi:dephospho-CoA kinase
MSAQKGNKLVIGVTGSMGSGKSTVARMLKGPDSEIIDADRIGHQLIRPGKDAYKRVVSLFGRRILRFGAIDRRKLGELVFADKALLKKLEAILHPRIIAAIRRGIALSRKRLIIVDAPLLLEAAGRLKIDRLVVVKCGRRAQLERLAKRGGPSRAEAVRRIKAQIPLRRKLARADFIIDNNGAISETRKQVEKVRRLWKS